MTACSQALQFTTNAACQLASTAVIGTAISAIAGVNPLVGAGMAAVAYLVTLIVLPMLENMPNYEGQGLPGLLTTAAFVTSWAASMTQLSQIFARAIGYAAPAFGYAAAIVVPAVALGTFVGNAIYHTCFHECLSDNC